jgi:uncharacterized protein YoaH (UPF0181 family)
MNDPNAKPVLTDENITFPAFADAGTSGSIDLGHINTNQGVIYQMTTETQTKPLNQTYYEEVEALKATGMSNPDAVRQVAKKHGKKENAVRGGLHQYNTHHVNGGAPTATPGRRKSAALSVDDYIANARQALESAVSLIEHEVSEAKEALDLAQARYDDVHASVKDRKADIEKKLAALS